MEFSTKKKKTPVIEESSSDDETSNIAVEGCPVGDNNVAPRSSERIRKKRNRKFHKPSKDEVWQKITPSKSPGKYDQLRPRKLVNNFTKENNRYNYDPIETSGDESMDDFVVDDEDCVRYSSSSDSACESDQQLNMKSRTPNRIRGRHHRLSVGIPGDDTSSTNSEAETYSVDRDCSKVTQGDVSDTGIKDDLTNRDRGCKSVNESDALERRKTVDDVADDENISDNGLNVSASGKRKRSVIDSDIESDESEIKVVRRDKRNRSVIEDTDSDEGVDVITELDVSESSENIKTSVADTVDQEGNIITGCIVVKHEPSESAVPGENSFKCGTNTTDVGFRHQSGSASNEVTDCLNIKSEEATVGTECQSVQKSSGTHDDVSEPVDDADSVTDESNGSQDTGSNGSDSEDSTSGSNDSESMSDVDSSDEDILKENSRIRVRKLRKKQEKDKLFEQFRKERERKQQKPK